MDNSEILKKYLELRNSIVAERNIDGFWTGELSSSALSTAVAIVTLKVAKKVSDEKRVLAGYDWLCQKINKDGGYGDTPLSESNVSTTLLCYAAIKYCQTGENGLAVLLKMEKWLSERGITIGAEKITSSILNFYGKDYTFSLPILSMLTLCEVIPSSSLEFIPRLPYEFALLPASLYSFLNLHVVSYALPALIGVGIYLQKNRKKGKLIKVSVRNLFIKPAIKKLDSILPQSGGFLEAIPLTGFVSMCLIACGEDNNNTVRKGIVFLQSQQREDGSWPIDTDLSTWVTTLAVKALGPQIYKALDEGQINLIRNHLIQLQYKEEHPFNGAKPGGWGWTSFPGSVPDVDDTSGAILALIEIYSGSNEEIKAIENGCRWIVDIQNTDGGFPTFCKGWGKLPFDKSCSDLTGHALLALFKTTEKLGDSISRELLSKIVKSMRKAVDFLTESQSDAGAWLPLWFGNQLTDDKTNPAYGTAKVCTYLSDCLTIKIPDNRNILRLARLVEKAQYYLITNQNSDGSWGGKKGITGTIEETSLAICALATKDMNACIIGIEWLSKKDEIRSAPIGLYFAMLWYDEKMYPLIYYTESLRRFIRYHYSFHS